jgi:hypothetical protein
VCARACVCVRARARARACVCECVRDCPLVPIIILSHTGLGDGLSQVVSLSDSVYHTEFRDRGTDRARPGRPPHHKVRASALSHTSTDYCASQLGGGVDVVDIRMGCRSASHTFDVFISFIIA